MSIEAYEAVWRNSKQTGGLKLTLLAMAEFASSKNDYTCTAAIATLADMVNVSERQMKKNLVKLESSGEIGICRNIGRGNTNKYDLKPLVNPDSIYEKGEPEDTILDEEKVNPSTEKVNSSTIKGEPQFTRTVINQKKDKSAEKSGNEVLPIEELVEHFLKESGCRKPHPNGHYLQDWIEPTIAIYRAAGNDFEATKQRINQAIETLRNADKTYTISCPGSIQNTAVSLKVKKKKLEIRSV